MHFNDLSALVCCWFSVTIMIHTFNDRYSKSLHFIKQFRYFERFLKCVLM